MQSAILKTFYPNTINTFFRRFYFFVITFLRSKIRIGCINMHLKTKMLYTIFCQVLKEYLRATYRWVIIFYNNQKLHTSLKCLRLITITINNTTNQLPILYRNSKSKVATRSVALLSV